MIKTVLVLSTVFFGITALPTISPKIDDNLDWRIVGGEDAPDGAYPYMILMRYGSSKKFRCGGSIISSTLILTAAHCVQRVDPSGLVVVVGTNKLDSGGTSYKVQEIRSHEGYNKKTIENDIALLKLESEIQFGDKVAPIDIPKSATGAGVEVALSGWGLTSKENHKLPNNLQHIKLKTLANDDCQKRVNSSLGSEPLLPIHPSQICTFTKKGEGACFGDSGSPLAFKNTVVGIASAVVPCAVGYPDLFTRVSAYEKWIADHSS